MNRGLYYDWRFPVPAAVRAQVAAQQPFFGCPVVPAIGMVGSGSTQRRIWGTFDDVFGFTPAPGRMNVDGLRSKL